MSQTRYQGNFSVFDENRTVTAVYENDFIRPRAILPKYEADPELKKLVSVAKELQEEFDDLKQLSHCSFQEKNSIAYEALLVEKGYQETVQIVRVIGEESKPDTCSWNKVLHREQKKGRNSRDERSLLYFPALSSVDRERPLMVTVEERIVGQELLDVIQACHLPLGAQRLGLMSNLFIQMCHGFAFLHEHGYTHNDIAPDNIMVENGHIRIKIIDFDSSVDVNNLSSRHRLLDVDGTPLHNWMAMKLYHKEAYRAIECWKAYELFCGDSARKVFLSLKDADTFSLLILFWEMLTGLSPPVDELSGADDLAKQYIGERGGERELAIEFETGFDHYFARLMDGIEPYPADLRENIETLFDDLASSPKLQGVRLPDGSEGIKVRVACRESVQDLLNLDWLRRARTI